MKAPKRFIRKVLHQSQAKDQPAPKQHASWIDVLTNAPGISKDAEARVKMTISCQDAAYIPKVKNAGTFKTIDGKKYQIMHNGVLVEAGGYFGDWMAEIITTLKGHHEPQEEKLFYEILKLIPANATMIELGSYWSYYSIWFNKAIKGAKNYCCEPDPENLKLGSRNASVNGAASIRFIQAAAGEEDGESISFKPQEGDRDPVIVPIRSVDGVIKEHKIKKAELLHMDIQGVELSSIKGAAESIKAGLIRFMFVSTHHYSISGDPMTHQKCIELIEELGGHIIAEHDVHESFSGDGLIVASFDKKDASLSYTITTNRMKDSLFRNYSSDLSILSKAYEKSA